MKKRIVSLLMALALCLSLLPTAAFAEQGEPAEQPVEQAQLEPAEPTEPAPAEPVESAPVEDAEEEEKEELPEEQEEQQEEQEQDEQPVQPEPAVLAMENGIAPLANGHTHYLCGGGTCNGGSHEKESVKTTFEKEIKQESDGTLKIGSESWTPTTGNVQFYELPAGTYYLGSDITPEYTIKITENVTLCLNGYTIESKDTSHVIELGNSATFNLTDCKTAGKLTHAAGKSGRGVYLYSGTFNMYGGSITGNTVTTSSSSGGVYVAGSSTFNMSGGSITNNKAGSLGNGGGVYVTGNGTFHMSSGSITGNTANVGGGVYVDGGSFKMSGGTISSNTARSGGGVYVYRGCTFEMSSGTISGNTATGNGGGVYVEGTFTMTGGSITGNTATSNTGNGGGVLVAADGTFNMSDGSITGNTAVRGGGVEVRGTFNMSGNASIADNNATEHGGGIYVNYYTNFYAGTFNMSGGSITGNNAGSNGGGVELFSTDCRFTMTGGSITGNNAGGDGGGVEVYGTFAVSGNVNITGNTKGATKGTDGKFADGTNSNVYLNPYTNLTITIGGRLTNGAKLGVTVKDADGDYPFTSGWKTEMGGNNPSDYFISDVDGYKAALYDTELKLVSTHTHSWTYTANGDTITATCKNCPINNGNDFSGGSVTIQKPEKTKFNDGKDENAKVESVDWVGETPSVAYAVKNSNALSVAPVNAGTYTAGITLGNVTVSVTYEITKATPTADDFTFTPPTDLTYNGSAKTASVNVKDGIIGMGETITVQYFDKDGDEVTEVKNAGEYTVKINVAAGTNYNAASDLTADGWEFTIAKADYTGTKKASANAVISQTGTDVYVTLPELPEGASYGEVSMDNTSTDKDGNEKHNIFNGGATITDGKLHLRVESNTAGLKAHVRVAVTGATNYQDYEIDITVTTVAKTPANVTVTGLPAKVTYGQEITLTAKQTGDTTGTNAAWSWEFNREYFRRVESDANDGTLTLQAIKAGSGTITVATATYESDDYVGSYTLEKSNIEPKLLEITGVTAIGRSYEPDNKSVGLTGGKLNGVVGSDDVGFILGSGTIESANAGENKVVTTSIQLTGEKKDNYTLTQPSGITVTITKATPSYTVPTGLTATYGQTLKDVTLPSGWSWKDPTESVGDATGDSSTLFDAVFTPTDTDNYNTVEKDVAVKVNKASGKNLGTIVLEQRYTDTAIHSQPLDWSQLPTGQVWAYGGQSSRNIAKNDLAVNGSTLTYQITDGVVDETITFNIKAMCDNYEDYTYTVKVTLTAKDNQPNFKFAESTKTVTYGDADFTVTATGQVTGSTVTYTSSNENVATVGNDGKVHIVGAGTATITAKAGETADYNEATASYTLTVNKRAITVTADNKTMTVNGKLPEFTVSYGNLPAGVKAEDIFGTLPTASTTADGKTVGGFEIAVTEVSLKDDCKKNYTVEIANGKLTVTKQSGGYYYYTPAAGGTTDAKKSPRTGDAGLLVYGLTALSSYTGTALVLRRKRED